MKLTSLPTGFFKLDGGAMFGVVPKSLWQRTNPADENNLCTWSMRLLLVEDGDRLTLIDTGIGQKQDEKFFSHYHLHGEDTLDRSLAAAGYHRSDITDVFLTHLHFDHVGGAVERRGDGMLVPAFPNATFWSNQRHWQWATEPNAREKASFLKENILPLQESGQLRFLDTPEGVRTVDTPLGFQAVVVNGHTEAQMLPLIPHQGSQLLYMGDLLPSVGHIPLPYVMGYDTRPLITLEEKTEILHRAAQENWTLFLEHDSVNTWCRLAETEKGPRLAEAGDGL